MPVSGSGSVAAVCRGADRPPRQAQPAPGTVVWVEIAVAARGAVPRRARRVDVGGRALVGGVLAGLAGGGGLAAGLLEGSSWFFWWD